ncbi:MAG TPA: GntR family transcriptional regulator [Devosiaceae bacterium]|jgi:DNA-binding GntR family transcriptional regulator
MNELSLDSEVIADDLAVGGTNYNRIRDAIRTSIFLRRYKPGERLKVQDLAKQFAVSAIPIREALQQLQGEGLVVITPNRGAAVRVIDKTLISNIFDIREAIDGMLARASAPVATEAQIEKLRSIEKAIEVAMETDDTARSGELGRNFHEYIGNIANNLEAVKIRRAHANVFRSVKTAMGPEHFSSSQRQQEHRMIIDAIARHDADAAEAAARKHAQAWRESVLDYFTTA